MKYVGKYTFSLSTENMSQTIVIRKNYRGYEGELICKDTCYVLENVHMDQADLIADVRGRRYRFTPQGGTVTTQDGKTEKLEQFSFLPHRRRALILYATMTKNTEKIANAFKAGFETYNWDVTMFRMKMNSDWESMQEQVYFDDYDVICLGSPIVAGYPLTVVNKVFSLGAGGDLENNVQKMVDNGGKFELGEATKGGGPMEKHQGKRLGAQWRRRGADYPGGPCRDNYQPLGIVFTTYGGGFYGSNEAKATLEALRLFLELRNVAVVGTFACCGKEFGPAGVEKGDKPHIMGDGTIADPVYYDTADGTKIQGSYFFHNQMWDHPNERDVQKAKYLVQDLVEDYFLTYDGLRGAVGSQYISIS